MECQVTKCNRIDNIQFVMVRNYSNIEHKKHKEYYCPKHLRERAFQLEALRISGNLSVIKNTYNWLYIRK